MGKTKKNVGGNRFMPLIPFSIKNKLVSWIACPVDRNDFNCLKVFIALYIYNDPNVEASKKNVEIERVFDWLESFVEKNTKNFMSIIHFLFFVDSSKNRTSCNRNNLSNVSSGDILPHLTIDKYHIGCKFDAGSGKIKTNGYWEPTHAVWESDPSTGGIRIAEADIISNMNYIYQIYFLYINYWFVFYNINILNLPIDNDENKFQFKNLPKKDPSQIDTTSQSTKDTEEIKNVAVLTQDLSKRMGEPPCKSAKTKNYERQPSVCSDFCNMLGITQLDITDIITNKNIDAFIKTDNFTIINTYFNELTQKMPPLPQDRIVPWTLAPSPVNPLCPPLLGKLSVSDASDASDAADAADASAAPIARATSPPASTASAAITRAALSLELAELAALVEGHTDASTAAPAASRKLVRVAATSSLPLPSVSRPPPPTTTEEKRMADDGKLYTKSEFKKFYSGSLVEWDNAKKTSSAKGRYKTQVKKKRRKKRKKTNKKKN